MTVASKNVTRMLFIVLNFFVRSEEKWWLPSRHMCHGQVCQICRTKKSQLTTSINTCNFPDLFCLQDLKMVPYYYTFWHENENEDEKNLTLANHLQKNSTRDVLSNTHSNLHLGWEADKTTCNCSTMSSSHFVCDMCENESGAVCVLPHAQCLNCTFSLVWQFCAELSLSGFFFFSKEGSLILARHKQFSTSGLECTCTHIFPLSFHWWWIRPPTCMLWTRTAAYFSV